MSPTLISLECEINLDGKETLLYEPVFVHLVLFFLVPILLIFILKGGLQDEGLGLIMKMNFYIF